MFGECINSGRLDGSGFEYLSDCRATPSTPDHGYAVAYFTGRTRTCPQKPINTRNSACPIWTGNNLPASNGVISGRYSRSGGAVSFGLNGGEQVAYTGVDFNGKMGVHVGGCARGATQMQLTAFDCDCLFV